MDCNDGKSAFSIQGEDQKKHFQAWC